MLASKPPHLGNTGSHRSPVTLQDLIDDLLWPHLLRSWKLALAPGRIALCFILTSFIVLLWKVVSWGTGDDVFGSLWHNIDDATRPLFHQGEKYKLARALYEAFILVPANFFIAHPIVSLVYIPLIVYAWCTVGGAVCRSCACEVSLRAALPWRQAVRFGIRKSLANFAAVAGPIALVWAACLLLKGLGLIFFTTKVGGLAGAFLFIAPLILCLVIAVAMVAYILAHSLLVPAVACEGTDSFDAVQRCYAYTLARPGRIVGYIAISLFATLPAAFVVSLVGMLAVYTAVTLTGAPAEPMETIFPGLLKPPEIEHWGATKGMLYAWIGLVAVLGLSYFVSLYFCASTNLYLVVRRLIDGQDITELWVPPKPAAAVIDPVTQPPASIPEKADYT